MDWYVVKEDDSRGGVPRDPKLYQAGSHPQAVEQWLDEFKGHESRRYFSVLNVDFVGDPSWVRYMAVAPRTYYTIERMP